MGLLDDLLKQVGSVGGAQGPGDGASLFSMLNSALSGHGGVQGLVDLFQRGGLGGVISSWIGTGANLPVSADELTQVLGKERLSQIAAQMGIPAEGAATRLAEVLPTLVDRATPDGRLPGSDLLGRAFDLLKR